MSVKKILITGVNGLIGKSLFKKLEQNAHYTVYGISRSATNENILAINFSEQWDEASLPKSIDVVIHLAQSDHFREFPDKADDIFNVNTLSTAKLLNYAKSAGAKKFIYASSGGVYGFGQEPFDENSKINANENLGFYLSTKLSSELLVQNYKNIFSTDILRFFFVYGEAQKKDMLIPRLINSVKNGTAVNLQGNDGMKLNPVYVEDAADAIIKCLDLEGNNVINIAGLQQLSLKEMCDIIGRVLKTDPVYKIDDTKPKNLLADISRMQACLLTPKHDFKDAILKLINNG